ncbi:MAG: glycosyltransferase family 39 protein [archaeon]
MKKQSKHYLLIILTLALILRLYHLTYPYLDHHSWRQTQTATIARNFYLHGFNIIKPEIDYLGNEPSVAELEFQITPYLTSILYIFLGVHDWVGRIVPIIFSLLSIYVYYLLIKLYYGEKLATLSSFVFAILPINIFFSRVQMPESGMLFFSIAGLYYFSMYVRQTTLSNYLFALFFVSMSFLSKIPNLFLLVPLAYIALSKEKINLKRKQPVKNLKLILFFALALGITVLYYGYMHFSADTSLIPYEGIIGKLSALLDVTLYQVLLFRLNSVVFTPLGLILFATGLILWRSKNKLFLVWLISLFFYLAATPIFNKIHSYYQLPIVPVGAFYIAYSLKIISDANRYIGIISGVILVVMSLQYVMPLYNLYAYSAYDAGQVVKSIDSGNSLIIAVPFRRDMMQELFYYSGRKGWLAWPETLSPQLIDEYKNKGAEYVVMTDQKPISYELNKYFENNTKYIGKNYLIIKI